MRTYPIVCPSCQGRGMINTSQPLITTQHTCPACHGTKVVICSDNESVKCCPLPPAPSKEEPFSWHTI